MQEDEKAGGDDEAGLGVRGPLMIWVHDTRHREGNRKEEMGKVQEARGQSRSRRLACRRDHVGGVGDDERHHSRWKGWDNARDMGDAI